jgi:hypothetical protein
MEYYIEEFDCVIRDAIAKRRGAGREGGRGKDKAKPKRMVSFKAAGRWSFAGRRGGESMRSRQLGSSRESPLKALTRRRARLQIRHTFRWCAIKAIVALRSVGEDAHTTYQAFIATSALGVLWKIPASEWRCVGRDNARPKGKGQTDCNDEFARSIVLMSLTRNHAAVATENHTQTMHAIFINTLEGRSVALKVMKIGPTKENATVRQTVSLLSRLA